MDEGRRMKWTTLPLMAAVALALVSQSTHADELPERSPRVTESVVAVTSKISAERLSQPLLVDGELSEWPTLAVPRARRSSDTPVLRTAQTPEGLALAVSSGALGRPWLLKLAISSVDDIEMPGISWRWRMGPSIVYASADDCEQPSDRAPGTAPPAYDAVGCRRWYAAQQEYRRALLGEFVREFEIYSDGRVVDPEATRAHYLPVRASELIRAQLAQPQPYRVELMLPWQALPPTNDLVLSRVYLRAELCWLAFNGDAIRSCAAINIFGPEQPAAVVDGEFVEVELPQPRHYQLTPCGFPLQADVRPGVGSIEPAFFLPTASLLLDSVFTLQEPTHGYQDRPEGLSPTAEAGSFSWVNLTDNERICFPGPVWQRADVQIAGDGSWVEPKGKLPPYDVVDIDDGNLLLISGPKDNTSVSGAGQCGACPRKSLAIWYLDRRSAGLTRAFAFNERYDDTDELEQIRIDLSADARVIGIESITCRWEKAEDPERTEDAFQKSCSTTSRQDWCLPKGSTVFAECAGSDSSDHSSPAD